MGESNGTPTHAAVVRNQDVMSGMGTTPEEQSHRCIFIKIASLVEGRFHFSLGNKHQHKPYCKHYIFSKS